MESEKITIEVNYTAKDYRPFLLRSLKGVIVRTAIFVFLLLFTVYVIASHFVVDELSETFRLFAAASLVVVPLITVVANLIDLERTAKVKANRNSPVTLEINETGVTSREEHRSATFEWEAYKKAIEYSDKFVIVSRNGGLLIPKRCFDNEYTIQSFRSHVRKGLNTAIVNK
jgi:hypothetical protein